MPDQNDFENIFAKLKAVIEPYDRKMDVACDTPVYYLLKVANTIKATRRNLMRPVT
jgi:hypothetical protein